ncbi:Protein adenylyltransferase SelO [Ralstonia wenshanensis]|uniref:protein adenylyltransferase SelO n=1 Tax=Ralstonia wenshanensis TaxID=2842456 RepID=UPI0028F66F6F|nr:YdiU family protein [Ralstonia wenshanensis]CAJ0819411.1 Protein adenylyltransferase SelO [Ralstonia wenshanensis]
MTASPAALPDDSLASPFDWPGRPAAAAGFSALGERFLTRLPPMPLPSGPIGTPYLVGFSPDAAASLGISRAELDTPSGLAVFTGNAVAAWSDPLATVYSGHQFGVWAGQLGDGRALLLAELQTAEGPCEVQLKGAGRTPYSRMGDGRAVLRSSIREFLCSEAMAGLGIPTTRALCVTGADAPIRREEIETAAVVTRLAPSFVRFGHFEHFSASEQLPQLRALADYVIDRFYPACRSEPQPYLALLRELARRTAELMADWQAVGFCHGVMNTDNMSILGLTLDYGPFGFLDGFNANHICNHSDTGGRYAYAQQPQIGYWNLFCLAQALLPLFGEDPDVFVNLSDEAQAQPAIDAAQNVLLTYRDVYGAAFYARYRAKLGLSTAQDEDETLFGDLFKLLHTQRTDYTLFFRHLADVRRDDTPAAAEARTVRDFFFDRAAADVWLAAYRQRLQAEPQSDDQRAAAMHRVNPKYVLRNHLAEIAIRRAKEKDFSEVENLRAVLARPFDDHPGFEHYAQPAPDWASSLEVSCSS